MNIKQYANLDISVDDDLLVRVMNVAPEDDIRMTALALGDLITEIMRDLAEEVPDEDLTDDDNDYGISS